MTIEGNIEIGSYKTGGHSNTSLINMKSNIKAGKLKFRSNNASYCLIEVSTKAGLTVSTIGINSYLHYCVSLEFM